MRFYVLCFSDYDGVAPHVIAEVVRDGIDDDPATTLATALAGDRAAIVTRTELLADPVGREALEAWESGDDKQFDRESEAILGSGLEPRLRAVEGQRAVASAPKREKRTKLEAVGDGT